MRRMFTTALALAAGLMLLASPGIAAEGLRAKGEPGASVKPVSSVSSREGNARAAFGASDAELDARYAAARQAAEKRERDWDRRMKQIVKDVCTGC